MDIINKLKNLDQLVLPNGAVGAVWLDDVIDIVDGCVTGISDDESYSREDIINLLTKFSKENKSIDNIDKWLNNNI